MQPALSIIIVNYKTPELLEQCLQTVYTYSPNSLFEVIVVDNYPENTYSDYIVSRFPAVKWIQMSYNAGFARANNEGIRQSIGDAVLLLNSDTLQEDDAIGNCYREFAPSTYVACGVQLLNPDKTAQISGNFAMRGGLNYLLPLPYIGAVVKGLGTLLRVKKPNVPEATATVGVDWINGAFLMVKKAAIEKAGLLDEDFFLYAEEAEWCSRLKKTGKLCIYGSFKVIHLQGATSNETFSSAGTGYYNLYDKKGLQILLSNIVRIRKQFGVGWYLFHLLTYTFTIPVFFLFSFFDNLFRLKNPFSGFRQAINYTVNVSKLWGYSGKILSNKPYFYKVL